jgi:hypothetical protein
LSSGFCGGFANFFAFFRFFLSGMVRFFLAKAVEHVCSEPERVCPGAERVCPDTGRVCSEAERVCPAAPQISLRRFRPGVGWFLVACSTSLKRMRRVFLHPLKRILHPRLDKTIIVELPKTPSPSIRPSPHRQTRPAAPAFRLYS